MLDKYNKLGQKGKPHGGEWAVLAGIVQSVGELSKDSLEVIALGTGNKCLGDSQRTPLGDIVRDSVC